MKRLRLLQETTTPAGHRSAGSIVDVENEAADYLLKRGIATLVEVLVDAVVDAVAAAIEDNANDTRELETATMERPRTRKTAPSRGRRRAGGNG